MSILSQTFDFAELYLLNHEELDKIQTHAMKLDPILQLLRLSALYDQNCAYKIEKFFLAPKKTFPGNL